MAWKTKHNTFVLARKNKRLFQFFFTKCGISLMFYTNICPIYSIDWIKFKERYFLTANIFRHLVTYFDGFFRSDFLFFCFPSWISSFRFETFMNMNTNVMSIINWSYCFAKWSRCYFQKKKNWKLHLNFWILLLKKISIHTKVPVMLMQCNLLHANNKTNREIAAAIGGINVVNQS